MSALLAFAEKSAVHVISDAASTEDDGTLGFVGTKVFALEDLPAVLVVLGQQPLSRLFLEWMSGRAMHRGFDDLATSLAQHFATFESDVLAPIAEADCDYLAVVAGWSEAALAPQIRYLAGSGHRMPSGMLHDANGFLVLGPRVPMPAELGGFLAKARSGADRPAFSAEAHAQPYFEAMRHHRQGAGFSTVGGFLEEVVVDRTAVSRRVVKTWPDRIGERIDV
ncbi:hypothetical protein [Ensifer sp. BR816]|uniref:hypothetical protein n=1 Tax=Rhizobium sp. (strain BR816) TaxID=1057002 RepID=UPI00037F7FED|nr:hypothetical protein [Ensifer sp. BR816]